MVVEGSTLLHRGQVQQQEVIGLFLITALPCAVFDSWLWFKALPSGTPLTVVVLAHLALLAFAYVNILWYQRRHWDLRFATVMAVLGSLLGPFGFVIAFLSALLYQLFSGVQLSAADLLKELLPEPDEHPMAETAHRLTSALDKVDINTTPVAFFDIMGFGSMAQKRSVISLTLRYFSPEFVSILRMGLHDKTNGIRVMAATAMIAVEKRYLDRFIDLQERIEGSPNSPTLLLAYADHCASFAAADILGAERATAMRRYAIQSYDKLCEEGFGSEDIACKLARVCLDDHDAAAVLVKLESYVKSQPSLELLSLYCEALYRLQRYEDLRAFVKDTLPSETHLDTASDSLRDSLKMWCGGKR